MHLKGFEKLGTTVNQNFGKIICEAEKITPSEISLDFPSVGATENIILSACLAEGTTILTNAAKEPEIEDMAKFLNKAGAKIKGAGTDRVEITGVKKLAEISYNIMPDRIEAGTYLVAGAITGGKIKITNVNPKHIEPILDKLEEANCTLDVGKNYVLINAHKKIKAVDIKTMPYPGFPTDMQSQMMSLLCLVNGSSIITETVFENRFMNVDELIRMGAKINAAGKMATIESVPELYGAPVKATDLRGGAAVVIAGLMASGITEVTNTVFIDRGYERFEDKLRSLGAKIERVEE